MVVPHVGDRRCAAKAKSTGQRCRRAPIWGGAVCPMHGGRAPQVKRRAHERLMALVDPAIDGLRRALESNDLAAVNRAARTVLDRTGYGPSQAIEIEDGAVQHERLVRACEAARLRPRQALALARALDEGGDATG